VNRGRNMLAVAASDVLVVADHSTLKYPPPTLPPSCRPAEEHNISAWATDNSTLYLASSHTISRYDPSSKQLATLYMPDDGYLIQCLVVKDKSTVIYGAGCNIHVLECGGQKPKVAQSFGPYKHDILSLSLSNDTTLLACGLSNAAYVQTLRLAHKQPFEACSQSRPFQYAHFIHMCVHASWLGLGTSFSCTTLLDHQLL